MFQLQNPMVIHVYHPYRQPDGVNHCAAVNGHCSHLCLPAPRIGSHSPRVSCACPTGLRLLPDNQMCVEDSKYTLFDRFIFQSRTTLSQALWIISKGLSCIVLQISKFSRGYTFVSPENEKKNFQVIVLKWWNVWIWRQRMILYFC